MFNAVFRIILIENVSCPINIKYLHFFENDNVLFRLLRKKMKKVESTHASLLGGIWC